MIYINKNNDVQIFDDHGGRKMITRWNINELYHGDEELYHHGVIGMRWGHRKQEYRSPNSARRKKIAKRIAIGAGVAGAAVGGAILAKKSGVNPLRAARSKLSRRPKMGTVSKVSRATSLGRFDTKISSSYKTAFTPRINGKKISGLSKPSGGIKRLLQRNGNVKVSQVRSQIYGKSFNRIGNSYTGVHTPTLNNRIAIPKAKIDRVANTSFGSKGSIPVTSRSWNGTRFVGGSTDGKVLGKRWIKSAYNWRKLPNNW